MTRTNEEHEKYLRMLDSIIYDFTLPQSTREAANARYIIAVMCDVIPLFKTDGDLSYDW